MADELDISGTHKRDEIATHLENLAKDLRQGKKVTLVKKENGKTKEKKTLQLPKNPEFAMDIDQKRSMLGDVKGTEMQMTVSWNPEEASEEHLEVK